MRLVAPVRRLGLWGLLCLGGLLGGGSAAAQVPPDSLSASRIQESVNAVLGEEHSITWIAHPLSAADKEALRPQLKGAAALPDTLYVGRVSTDEGPRFLIPDATPSKSKTFSLLLYLNGERSVVGVDVLTYRENYGYEVDYPMFRRQFHGKRRPSDVRFQRSIQNISGATISARSMTYAVHDLLAVVNQVGLDPFRPSAN
ncbi:MAG: FMN-binding protein [Salinibacter sp.]